MKRPWLKIWAIASTVVALGLAFALWRERELRAAALATGVASDLKTDAVFAEFQAITFAREFSERFLDFDSQSFQSTQTAVAFLMGGTVRERRLDEIERLVEKIRESGASQRAHVTSIRRGIGGGKEAGFFIVEAHVELKEAKQVGANAVSAFVTTLGMKLERVAPSIENPWGLRVSELEQKVAAPQAAADRMPIKRIGMRPEQPLLIQFPCSIENVEWPKGTKLKVKLTTLDVSELQLRSDGEFSGEAVVRAVCRDSLFQLTIVSDATSEMVFQSLALDDGEKQVPSAAAKRKRTAVEKTIEEQLGFVTED